jgi:hypothetical protein
MNEYKWEDDLSDDHDLDSAVDRKIWSMYLDGRLVSLIEAEDFKQGFGSVELTHSDRLMGIISYLQKHLTSDELMCNALGTNIGDALYFVYDLDLESIALLPSSGSEVIWFKACWSVTDTNRVLVMQTNHQKEEHPLIAHYDLTAKLSLLNGPALEPFAESCRQFWHWVNNADTTVENRKALKWFGEWMDVKQTVDTPIVQRLNGICPVTRLSKSRAEWRVLFTNEFKFHSVSMKVKNVKVLEDELKRDTTHPTYYADSGPLNPDGNHGKDDMCVGECVDGGCPWCLQALRSKTSVLRGVGAVMNYRTLAIDVSLSIEVSDKTDKHKKEEYGHGDGVVAMDIEGEEKIQNQPKIRTVESSKHHRITIQLPLPSRGGAIRMRTGEWMVPSLSAPSSKMWRQGDSVSQRCGTLYTPGSFVHGSLHLSVVKMLHGEIMVTIDPGDTSKNKNINNKNDGSKRKTKQSKGQRKWAASGKTGRVWTPPRVPVRLPLDTFVICMCTDWGLGVNIHDRLRFFGCLSGLDDDVIDRMCKKYKDGENVSRELARKLWTEATCPAGVDQKKIGTYTKKKEINIHAMKARSSKPGVKYQNQTGHFIPPYQHWYRADFRHGNVDKTDRLSIKTNLMAGLQWIAMACRVLMKSDIKDGRNESLSISLTPYHIWVKQLIQKQVLVQRAISKILDSTTKPLKGIQVLASKKQTIQNVPAPATVAAVAVAVAAAAAAAVEEEEENNEVVSQMHKGSNLNTSSAIQFVDYISERVTDGITEDASINIERASEPEGLAAYVVDKDGKVCPRSATNSTYSPDVKLSGQSSAELQLLGTIQVAVAPARIELRKQLHRTHPFVSSDTPYNKSGANEVASVAVGCIMSRTCTEVDKLLSRICAGGHPIAGKLMMCHIHTETLTPDFKHPPKDPVLVFTSTGCIGWIPSDEAADAEKELCAKNREDGGHAAIHLNYTKIGGKFKPSVLWVCTKPGRLMRFALIVDNTTEKLCMEDKLDTAIGEELKGIALNRAGRLFGVGRDKRPSTGYWDLVRAVRAQQAKLIKSGAAKWVDLVHVEAGLLCEGFEMDQRTAKGANNHVIMTTGVMGLRQTRLHDSQQALECVPPERMVVGPHASNADPDRGTTFVRQYTTPVQESDLIHTWDVVDLVASNGLQGAWDLSRPRCVSVMGPIQALGPSFREKESNTYIVTTYPLVGRAPSLPMITHTFSHKGNANDVAVVIPLDVKEGTISRHVCDQTTQMRSDHTKNAFDVIIYPGQVSRRSIADVAQTCHILQEDGRVYGVLAVGSIVRYREIVATLSSTAPDAKDVAVVINDFATSNAHLLLVVGVVARYKPSDRQSHKTLDFLVVSLQRINHSTEWLDRGVFGHGGESSWTPEGALSPRTSKTDLCGMVASKTVASTTNKERTTLQISRLHDRIDVDTHPELTLTKYTAQQTRANVMWIRLNPCPNYLLGVPLTYTVDVMNGEICFTCVHDLHRDANFRSGHVRFVHHEVIGKRPDIVELCGQDQIKIIQEIPADLDTYGIWLTASTPSLVIKLDMRATKITYIQRTLSCDIPRQWNGMRVAAVTWDGLSQVAEITTRVSWKYVVVKCVRLKSPYVEMQQQSLHFVPMLHLDRSSNWIDIEGGTYEIPESCMGWHAVNFRSCVDPEGEDDDSIQPHPPSSDEEQETVHTDVILTVCSYGLQEGLQVGEVLDSLKTAGFANSNGNPVKWTTNSDDIRVLFIREMDTQALRRKVSDLAVANKMYPCHRDDYSIPRLHWC